MVTIKYKTLKRFALSLLALPAIVFFLTWLKLYIGIPAAILLALAIALSSKNESRTINIKPLTIITVIIVVVVWALLSGQGEFFTQKADYLYRNAIFRDLINNPWPVRYSSGNDESLVYYIGYWLVPAIFGKLGAAVGGASVGWLVGRVAVLVWTIIIITTVFLVLCFKFNSGNKKTAIIVITVLILFSGMDALGAVLSCPERFSSHIEWWAGNIQFSSMSTQLCWVFNQAVPAWLATALFINEKSTANYALIGLLLLSTSPLPLVGLAVLMVIYAIKALFDAIKNKAVPMFIKQIFTAPNILAIISLLPVYLLYYLNNSASFSNSTANESSHLIAFDSSFLFSYVLFVLFEFLILLLVLKSKKNTFDVIVIGISLLIIPIIRIGDEYDFCMRASIPALFVLMTMLMQYFINKPRADKKSKEYQKYQRKAFALILIFLIGCATPAVEYISSINKYISTSGECVTQYDSMESLNDIPINSKRNFVGENSSDSAFYKYIGRR